MIEQRYVSKVQSSQFRWLQRLELPLRKSRDHSSLQWNGRAKLRVIPRLAIVDILLMSSLVLISGRILVVLTVNWTVILELTSDVNMSQTC